MSDTAATVPDWLVLPSDVDLTSCDREAIHLPGATQAHGTLLLVDPEDGTVAGASANAVELLMGSPGAPPLGLPLAELVDDAHADRLATLVATAGRRTSATRAPTSAGVEGTWLCHRSGPVVVVEFEPRALTEQALEVVLARVARATEEVGRATTLAGAEEATARHVRELLGVDRAMVYRFHPDGHGEVVAEDLVTGEPFLGLHYPATDVPRQARALYVRNWTRLIADVQAEDVPLLGRDGRRLDDVDLSGAQLRAVSPIHLEYLRNMGVRASMSLSLVVGGELVGLVACHHGEPLRVPYGLRLCGELLARNLSEQLGRVVARQHNEARERRRSAQLRLLGGVGDAAQGSALLQGAADELRALLEAHVFAAWADGDDEPVAWDAAEDVDAPDALALHAAVDGAVGAEDEVVTDDLTSTGADLDGGLLALRARDLRLVWWRAPQVTTVVWAGNPDKAVDDEDGSLTPRGSFDAWRETVAGRGRPWTDGDVEVAHGVADAFRAAVASTDGGPVDDVERVVATVVAMNEDLRAAHRRQARAIEDLEDMLSLVAHDIRGMLASLGGHADLLRSVLTGEAAERTSRSTDAISRGVQNIGRLLDDTRRWAAVGHTAATHDGVRVELRVAAETAVAALADRIDTAGAVVEVGDLPAVHGDPGLLREVLQNLVENSVKYRSPERPLRIRIAEVGPRPVDEVVVAVEDNGLGIDPADHARALRAFEQIDRSAPGSGLGLALVRRVVEAHGGTVTLGGAPGVGTTVTLRFPEATV